MRQNSPGSFLVVHCIESAHPQSQICVSLPAGDMHRCIRQHLARLAELYSLTFVSACGLSLCIMRSNVLGRPSRVSRTQRDYCCTANASKQCDHNASFILRCCSLQWGWSSQWIFGIRSVKSDCKPSWKASAGWIICLSQTDPKGSSLCAGVDIERYQW